MGAGAPLRRKRPNLRSTSMRSKNSTNMKDAQGALRHASHRRQVLTLSCFVAISKTGRYFALVRTWAAKAILIGFRSAPRETRSLRPSFYLPLCKAHIVYTSMHPVIASSRRKCPSCQGELLINDGTVSAVSERKPPKQETPLNAKRPRK